MLYTIGIPQSGRSRKGVGPASSVIVHARSNFALLSMQKQPCACSCLRGLCIITSLYTSLLRVPIRNTTEPPACRLLRRVDPLFVESLVSKMASWRYPQPRARLALLDKSPSNDSFAYALADVFVGLIDAECLRLAARHNINRYFHHEMTHRGYVSKRTVVRLHWYSPASLYTA